MAERIGHKHTPFGRRSRRRRNAAYIAVKNRIRRAAPNCCDNAPMESFWSSLKNEQLHRLRFATAQQAIDAVFDYIATFYNPHRLATGWKQARYGACGGQKVLKKRTFPQAAAWLA